MSLDSVTDNLLNKTPKTKGTVNVWVYRATVLVRTPPFFWAPTPWFSMVLVASIAHLIVPTVNALTMTTAEMQRRKSIAVAHGSAG